MRLKVHISDTNIIIYREKWGAIAFSCAGALACLFVAAVFFWIAQTQNELPTIWIYLFAVMFGCVGAALLIRLPRHLQHIMTDQGARQLIANRDGIQFHPHLHAEPIRLPWNAISDIVLTRQLKQVDHDGTTWHVNILILFLASPSSIKPLTFRHVRTGDERYCFLGDYPAADVAALEHALRAMAPAAIPVQHVNKTVFDQKQGINRFE